MANNNPSTPGEHLQQMNILYLALLGGQVMVAGMLYFFIQSESGTEMDSATSVGGLDLMSIIGILVFVTAAGASFFIYNKRKAEGTALNGSLMEKLDHYRASFVLRASLLEGPNLMLLILYFFMGASWVLLVLFGIGLGLFSIIRPSVDKITQDYELSASEQSELRNAMN